MITCPSCQHQNETGASFCNQCGYPLQVSDAATGADPSSPINPSPPLPSNQFNPSNQASGTSPQGDVPDERQPLPGSPPLIQNQGGSISPGHRGMPIAIVAIAGAVVVAAIVVVAVFLTRSPQPKVAESPTSEPSASPATSPSISPNASPGSRVALPPPSPSPVSALAETQDIKAANFKVWRVVDDGGLNCRSGPGVSNKVQKTFAQGKELSINAKYEDPLQYDPDGKPWLAVGQPGLDCFVRANESLIAAVPNRATSDSQSVSKDNCPGDTLYTFFAETKGFYINLCEAVDGSDLYYVGNAKNGSGEILLPIDDFDENGYYASNGNVKYFLDLLNDKLVVTQAGKTLLEEGFITSAVVQ